jgi:hypothetical protein
MPRRAQKRAPDRAPLDLTNPATLDTLVTLELAQRTSQQRYATDPWAFVSECVYTLDQIKGAIRPFPSKVHLEYLTRAWLQEPQLVVIKSRRMTVTWLFVALYYWLARFRPGSKIALCARKEGKDESEGSAELVARAKFIHEHLPPTLAPIEMDYHFCRLAFPEIHSEIIGVASGSDQLRQMTLSGVLADEFAFWEQDKKTYTSLRPTLEGGGRLTIVSSAPEAPGTLLEALVFDGLNRSEHAAA